MRGERPQVGSVEIGGRTVPWPAAPRWCGSYGWAAKDLKHLHYDGEPIFADAERPGGQRRQTVAERARGVRSRVLPVAPDGAARGSTPSDARRRATTRPTAPAEHATVHEERDAQPAAVGNAFSAMEGETPAAAESAPVAASDTQPE